MYGFTFLDAAAVSTACYCRLKPWSRSLTRSASWVVNANESPATIRHWRFRAAAALLMLLGPLLFAQRSPRVTDVDPSSGKVNDTVTVAGENLGKGTVSAVFLSDDKTDYKATLVEQDEEKIVMKVPHVRPGRYNISVQTGNAIYIQPVRFTVQE